MQPTRSSRARCWSRLRRTSGDAVPRPAAAPTLAAARASRLLARSPWTYPSLTAIETGTNSRSEEVAGVTRLAELLDDGVEGLLAHHVDRQRDEGARDAREDARVDDAEAFGAADAELRVEDGLGVTVGADRSGARGVVAPRFLLDPVADLRAVVRRGARPDFFVRGEEVELVGLALDAANHLDTVDDRGEVVDVLARVDVAVVEVVEVDLRPLAGVRAAQLHGATAVVGVALEDEPGEVVLR